MILNRQIRAMWCLPVWEFLLTLIHPMIMRTDTRHNEVYESHLRHDCSGRFVGVARDTPKNFRVNCFNLSSVKCARMYLCIRCRLATERCVLNNHGGWLTTYAQTHAHAFDRQRVETLVSNNCKQHKFKNCERLICRCLQSKLNSGYKTSMVRNGWYLQPSIA